MGVRQRRHEPSGRARGSEGAAAVEFALISGILFLLLFGILQYGLYFNDSLSVRQGVREAARQGVVKTFTPCGAAVTDLDKLRCQTQEQIGTITGETPYVKINFASPWTKGQPLTVCTLVKTNTIGILPMPNDGWIASKTQLSIEQAATPPTGSAGTDRALPAGAPSWPTGC